MSQWSNLWFPVYSKILLVGEECGLEYLLLLIDRFYFACCCVLNCVLTFTAKASSDSAHGVSFQKSVMPSLVPPTRPEEDILFQWRLRRKMEQARERPLSVQASSPHAFGWQSMRLSYPSISEQAYKVGIKLFVTLSIFFAQIYRITLICSSGTAGYPTPSILTKRYSFTHHCCPARNHWGPEVLSPSSRPFAIPHHQCFWFSPSAAEHCPCSFPHAFSLWRLAMSHPVISCQSAPEHFTKVRRVTNQSSSQKDPSPQKPWRINSLWTRVTHSTCAIWERVAWSPKNVWEEQEKENGDEAIRGKWEGGSSTR